MKPTISILIITYNRVEDTLALLENLKEQDNFGKYVGEILLLNNASTISYRMVEAFVGENEQMSIQYIKSEKNLGVAGGRNLLVKKARYPYLLVLDDDVVFPAKGSLEIIATLLEKPQYQENNTAVITLNIHYFDTKERQKSALPHKNYEEYKDKPWFFTYYFVGAAHIMHKALFDKTGYYPEDFFYGMEEYDLSYRILDAGYSLAYDSSVIVWHKESPLGRVTQSEKLGMMWLNKCKVAWCYLPNKYFYSTAIMWSFEYLKKTKLDFNGFFKIWKKVSQIPYAIFKKEVSKSALAYLDKVKARLWY